MANYYIKEGNIFSLDEIYTYLELAFPKEERKTKEHIRKLILDNTYRISFLCEYGKKEHLGYAIFVKENGLLFLDYFNIKEEYQGIGLGSIFLKLLTKNECDIILLEIEKPIDYITKRREHFYFKNGAQSVDIPYRFPTKDGYLDMVLLYLKKEPRRELDGLKIREFLMSTILKIHSDYPHTKEIIQSYIELFPKTL